MADGMSLADVAAVNGGFGGGWEGVLYFAIIASMFGGGWGGLGGNNGVNALNADM